MSIPQTLAAQEHSASNVNNFVCKCSSEGGGYDLLCSFSSLGRLEGKSFAVVLSVIWLGLLSVFQRQLYVLLIPLVGIAAGACKQYASCQVNFH